jgi:hypothetical protein
MSTVTSTRTADGYQPVIDGLVISVAFATAAEAVAFGHEILDTESEIQSATPSPSGEMRLFPDRGGAPHANPTAR